MLDLPGKCWWNLKGCTEHEADAYFLAYHGTRFYLSCLTEAWPRSILSEKERNFFLKSSKPLFKRKKIDGKFQKVNTGEKESTAMLDLPGKCWWNLKDRDRSSHSGE